MKRFAVLFDVKFEGSVFVHLLPSMLAGDVPKSSRRKFGLSPWAPVLFSHRRTALSANRSFMQKPS